MLKVEWKWASFKIDEEIEGLDGMNALLKNDVVFETPHLKRKLRWLMPEFSCIKYGKYSKELC